MVLPDIYIYLLLHFFHVYKKFYLTVLYGFLDLVYFSGCRRASHVMSQGDIHLLRRATNRRVQSESCYQSDHDLRIAYFSESYAGSAYTSRTRILMGGLFPSESWGGGQKQWQCWSP